MASTEKRTIWLVIDHGGEYDGAWDWVECAFTDELIAKECAEKRQRRHKARKDPYEWDDYVFTDVQSVTLVESGNSGER